MTDIKKIYEFASWPVESIVDKDGLSPDINFRLDTDTGFRLIERYPMPYPKSYEDVYASEEDVDIRISMQVINCDSFDQAKELLLNHLSECVALGLPQITDQLDECSADIAFGTFDGLGKGISAVRGNALIMLRNIGSKSIDLIPLYSTAHECINRMRQHKLE